MGEMTEQQQADEQVANVALRGEAWWHNSENSLRMAVDKFPIPLSAKTWFGDLAVQAWTEGAITAVQEYGDEMRESDAAFDNLWDRNMKAVSAWRDAHPGNDLVLPDMTVMLDWLLTHVEKSISTDDTTEP
jgi:hypothetical protein